MNLTNMLIPWWAKLLCVILVVGTIYGAGVKSGYDVRDYSATKALVAQQQKDLKQQKDLQQQLAKALADKKTASDNLQTALAQKKVVTQYVTRNVTKEVQIPVYGQCVIPKSGLDIINDDAKRLNAVRSQK